jgi:formyl-CoA transferase
MDVPAAEFYRDARADLVGPLHGVRVIDVTKVWSGPIATCILADLGADVLRVEMPGNREGLMPPEIPGTGLSWFRQTVHRNKRSVGLDLRRAGAAELFLHLVETADVVVENYRPGTLDGWGVGYRQCRVVRPDVIFVSISGYGQFGRDVDRPGYDPTTQAAAGWMSLNGEPDGPPLKAPTFLADDLAGLHATIGTLAALRHRDHTGEGQHVDVSMFDAALFSSNGYLTLGATGVPLHRWGDQADFVVPAGCYACADGYVYIAVALDKHWRRLADVVGRPELATATGYAKNEERRTNRKAVNGVLAEWCAHRTAAAVVETLAANGITAEKVRTFAEVAADPRVRDRHMLQNTVLANGTVAALTGPAVKFSRTPTAVRGGAPEPGADTDDLLDELGVDAAARERLRAERAIG